MLKLKPLFLIAALAITSIFSAANADSDDIFPINLKNTTGDQITIQPQEDEITVLEWFNKGCPFVKKFYKSGHMQFLQGKYKSENVKWYSINSTKAGHGDYIAEDQRVDLSEELKFQNTETLYDEDGKVGQRVGAKTTPHVFIFKGENLIYSGAVDDAPDSDSDPKDADNHIENVLTALAKGEDVSVKKTRPYGCSVKYAE